MNKMEDSECFVKLIEKKMNPTFEDEGQSFEKEIKNKKSNFSQFKEKKKDCRLQNKSR